MPTTVKLGGERSVNPAARGGKRGGWLFEEKGRTAHSGGACTSANEERGRKRREPPLKSANSNAAAQSGRSHRERLQDLVGEKTLPSPPGDKEATDRKAALSWKKGKRFGYKGKQNLKPVGRVQQLGWNDSKKYLSTNNTGRIFI